MKPLFHSYSGKHYQHWLGEQLIFGSVA